MILPSRQGYEDLRITAFAPKTSAPTQADFSTAPASYVLQSWSFANNGTERGLNGVTQIPHGITPGSDAYLHLHLSSTGALAEGAIPGFFCSLMVQKIGVALASAYTQLLFLGQTVPVGGYGAKTHIMTDAFTIPAAQLERSALVFVYVFRVKGTELVTDNLGAKTEAVNDVLWLHEVDLHVRTNRFGTVMPTA